MPDEMLACMVTKLIHRIFGKQEIALVFNGATTR